MDRGGTDVSAAAAPIMAIEPASSPSTSHADLGASGSGSADAAEAFALSAHPSRMPTAGDASGTGLPAAPGLPPSPDSPAASRLPSASALPAAPDHSPSPELSGGPEHSAGPDMSGAPELSMALSAKIATLPGANRPSYLGASNSPQWLGKRVGRFRLIGMIGKGAMGRVFRAEDVQLHRLVALKVISSRSSRSRKRTAAEKLELLVREARSAAKLEHPNIVSVYEVNSAADIHFIAMELVEGGNLKDLVTAAGPLDVPRACQLAADAAEGLQHAHEQGVVHRDIKPANLMLTRAGRCKIADFGLARIDDPSDMRSSGGAVGTPQFVSPEVVQGHEATAMSDVYSLGATLFFLLTGTVPFPGETSREVVRKHVEEMPPDVRLLRPEIPESLALAVYRAMGKDPTSRFESAGHFARALRLHTIGTAETSAAAAAAEQGLSAGMAEPARKYMVIEPRHLALVGLLGGGVVAALCVAVVVLAMAVGRTAPAAVVPLPPKGKVLDAADGPTLLRVANEPDPLKHDGRVTVRGNLLRLDARPGPVGYALAFRGVDQKAGLAVVVADQLARDRIAEALKLDPTGGAGDRRLRIDVRGIVVPVGGQPVLTVTSANQVELVPASATDVR
jgi:serine/threonine protein kinase